MAIAVDNLADADSLTTIEKEDEEGEEAEEEQSKIGSIAPSGEIDDEEMRHSKRQLDDGEIK